jgi:hypothetical protein
MTFAKTHRGPLGAWAPWLLRVRGNAGHLALRLRTGWESLLQALVGDYIVLPNVPFGAPGLLGYEPLIIPPPLLQRPEGPVAANLGELPTSAMSPDPHLIRAS